MKKSLYPRKWKVKMAGYGEVVVTATHNYAAFCKAYEKFNCPLSKAAAYSFSSITVLHPQRSGSKPSAAFLQLSEAIAKVLEGHKEEELRKEEEGK